MGEDIVDLLAGRLEGTCMEDPESILEKEGVDLSYFTPGVQEELYERVDLCGGCGWWYDRSELLDDEEGDGDNGLICEDCVNEIAGSGGD